MPPTVALVMMPFGPADRPSLGLSLLARCLDDVGIATTTLYPSLDFARRIGRNLYDDLSFDMARALAGEWLFSQILDPIGGADDFMGLADRRRRRDKASTAAFDRLAKALPATLVQARALIDDWAASIARMQPRVVGLSSSYQQHLASLALAQRIRELCPETLIALGGTNCNAPMGEETFRRYGFVDAVVTGPGEIAFVELVQRHLAGMPPVALPGIHRRAGDTTIAPATPVAPEPDLDRLPMPVFDDFFAAWQEAGPPAIPIEASRGCWWGQKHHCVFCSENAHSMRYRAKSPDRLFAEFAWMLDRYPGSRICATDEILDLKLLDGVMPRLAARDDRRRIFFSVKANLRKDQLALLAAAGVTALQPGIESLADEILLPMRKGVTALQNIQMLKWCREFGIATVWGILHGFPFEEAASYTRMATLVPSLTHLQPPKVASVALQRYSPLYEQAEQFGIRDIVPHESYRWIYRADDEAIGRLAYRFQYRASGEGGYVQPLRDAVAAWAATAGQAHLFYVDETGRLLIGDTRPAAIRRVHRLTGPARAAYLLCDRVQPGATVARSLRAMGHDLDDDAIARLLAGLVADRLMAEDRGRHLSLAAKAGRRYLPPVGVMAEVLAEGRRAAG